MTSFSNSLDNNEAMTWDFIPKPDLSPLPIYMGSAHVYWGISIDGPASASYRDALFSVKPPKPIELGLAHFISHCRRLGTAYRVRQPQPHLREPVIERVKPASEKRRQGSHHP
jgi:hypothetical protein